MTIIKDYNNQRMDWINERSFWILQQSLTRNFPYLEGFYFQDKKLVHNELIGKAEMKRIQTFLNAWEEGFEAGWLNG